MCIDLEWSGERYQWWRGDDFHIENNDNDDDDSKKKYDCDHVTLTANKDDDGGEDGMGMVVTMRWW